MNLLSSPVDRGRHLAPSSGSSDPSSASRRCVPSPVREPKTGRAGYAPVFANEWVRSICEKPRIKCADCPHRRFFLVTDPVVRWHLSGEDADGQPFVAGVHPAGSWMNATIRIGEPQWRQVKGSTS